ncbi:MAG: type II secretion system major pseudopilin GspG [Candidatus Babeliales bacterium]
MFLLTTPYLRKGFSLIEILVAIAIIAMIAVTLGPYALNEYKKSQVKSAKLKVKELQASIEFYEMDVGKLPEQLADLTTKPSDSEAAKNWGGPYIKGVKGTPKDPWGTPYQYLLTSGGGDHPYELYSYGPKRRSAPQSEWISVWDL